MASPTVRPTTKAAEEADIRTRHSGYSDETQESIRKDLELRLSAHSVLTERIITAELQRSILKMTRGMDF